MPYLKVDEYIDKPIVELINKFLEEIQEVEDEYLTYNVEALIAELHDVGQISNTIIHNICKREGLDYDTEYKKHIQKIKDRGVKIER